MTFTPQLTPLHYETPTVTLEVMTREAAVTRWSDKPVVQVLRYQLEIRSLDEAETPIAIQGDRETFLPLIEAVQHYLQAQLGGEAGSDRPANGPFLEPQGLTRHLLHLGNCRTSSGASTISLGAIQLADLGAVCDQLETQVRPLPVPLQSVARRASWRQWGAAAAGIVAAVGVTTALWPTYQPQRGMETAEEAPSLDNRVPESAEPERFQRSLPPAESPPRSDPLTAIAPESSESTATPPPASPPPPGTADSATAQKSPDALASDSDRPQKSPATTPPAAIESAPLEVEPAPPAQSSPAPAPETDPQNAEERPLAAPEDLADLSLPEAPATPPAVVPEAVSPPSHEDAAIAGGALRSHLLTLDDLAAALSDRWTPLPSLTQPLTYLLTVAADGTVSSIAPDTARSRQYRDRVPLPDLGSRLLVPGSPRQLRVSFNPDGTVQVIELGTTEDR